jgi:hypothetical protein
VASEGLPALFYVSVQTLFSDEPKAESGAEFKSLKLPGNVLDVAIIGTKVIASIDNIHEAGSTTSVDTTTVRSPAWIYSKHAVR